MFANGAGVDVSGGIAALALVLFFWPYIACTFSVVISWLHSYEESGATEVGKPLWEYYPLPTFGAVIVSVLLPILTSVLAVWGYVRLEWTVLGFLCGMRLGDAVFTHALGPRLPGLWTALLLAAEGGLLLLLIRELPSWPVAAGAFPFALALFARWFANILTPTENER